MQIAHNAARSVASHGARVLSVLEKAKLVCWLEETNSFAQVARRYRAEFGMEPPHLEQVRKWHQRFLATGSINNGNGHGHHWTDQEGPEAPASEQKQQPRAPQARGDESAFMSGLEAEEQLKMAGIR